MTQREKLVEIIQNSVGGCARHWAEVIADGLLANGVIVLPCDTDDMATIKASKCWKCVNEVKCKVNGIYKSNCPDYKRDAPDGGYYG
ncbi:MAG: hypothetical protein J6Q67_06255 [Clostridia bacterium]|nr:hypothetical protein [Clostridia bacterium]